MVARSIDHTTAVFATREVAKVSVRHGFCKGCMDARKPKPSITDYPSTPNPNHSSKTLNLNFNMLGCNASCDRTST